MFTHWQHQHTTPDPQAILTDSRPFLPSPYSCQCINQSFSPTCLSPSSSNIPVTGSAATTPLVQPPIDSRQRTPFTSVFVPDPRTSPLAASEGTHDRYQSRNISMATAGSAIIVCDMIQPSTPASCRQCPSLSHEGVSQSDLLAAMREQQAFIAKQLQEERVSSRNALREQHEFMANQQRQLNELMSLLDNRPSRSEPDASLASQAIPKFEIRMGDPPSFDGSTNETENFLSSLENIFDSQPLSFPTNESRIRYTLTFLTGRASIWRKLLLRDVRDGNFSLTSWDAFERRFRETFGNPILVEEARRKLWTIRQGQRNSEDFFLEFEEIRLEADICEKSVIMFLLAALRPDLLEEIKQSEPQPKSYIDWKTATLKADQNQRNLAAIKAFQSRSNNSSYNQFRRNSPD